MPACSPADQRPCRCPPLGRSRNPLFIHKHLNRARPLRQHLDVNRAIYPHRGETIWTSRAPAVGLTSWFHARGRSCRICCFFVLPLIFLDFFRLRFSFVYLCCVPNSSQAVSATGGLHTRILLGLDSAAVSRLGALAIGIIPVWLGTFLRRTRLGR